MWETRKSTDNGEQEIKENTGNMKHNIYGTADNRKCGIHETDTTLKNREK